MDAMNSDSSSNGFDAAVRSSETRIGMENELHRLSAMLGGGWFMDALLGCPSAFKVIHVPAVVHLGTFIPLFALLATFPGFLRRWN